VLDTALGAIAQLDIFGFDYPTPERKLRDAITSRDRHCGFALARAGRDRARSARARSTWRIVEASPTWEVVKTGGAYHRAAKSPQAVSATPRRPGGASCQHEETQALAGWEASTLPWKNRAIRRGTGGASFPRLSGIMAGAVSRFRILREGFVD